MHAKARVDNQNKLIPLEQMTVEQLQKVAEEYALSPEGTQPELVARIREYEFKTGKTEQPHNLRSSQSSVQPEIIHPAQSDPQPKPIYKAKTPSKDEKNGR